MLDLPRDPVAPVLSQDHFARFYDRDATLVREVADFLDVALRAGDAAVVIATLEHRRLIEQRLRGLGPRKGMASWYSGELVLLDAAETLALFMVDDRPDEKRFIDVVGSVIEKASAGVTREVRAFGEMVALLCEQGHYEAALELEQLWNGLAALHSFQLFCAYPMHLFAGAEHAHAFDAVCRVHQHVRGFADARAGDAALTLATLQQRTAALEAEVAKRRQAEALLRQREKELADFLDNALEGLHRVGPDGTILWANQAELDLLGYSAAEYIGQPFTTFHADAAVAARIFERLHAGEALYDEPALLRCKDGSLKPVRIHSNGSFENGELVYTRCFTRDVSDRVALERSNAERDVLLAELTEANRAKDEFLAMLGHELRNPLSPIATALQLMRMRGETKTLQEQQIIQRQVNHLMRLVDDLLDVSRITRGKVELRREPLDMADVLTRAVEIASPLLEQRSHRLTIDIRREGLRCVGDPVRLAQVVSNLLTNAARYTPRGGDVQLWAAREDDQIVVRVCDNGVGIAPEALPRLFDLFFQGPRSIDRADGGLGLGLALVKNLVGLHGGSVAAHSDGPGSGSRFELRLPADEADAIDTRAAHEQAGVAPDGLRILLVDDNTDAAQTLGALLEAYGHAVIVVHDPAAALQALETFTPQLALLDIGLPVMDGYQLGSVLRERLGDGCRLIALTGYGQDADRARSERAGFAAHLVKPIDPDVLLQLLG